MSETLQNVVKTMHETSAVIDEANSALARAIKELARRQEVIERQTRTIAQMRNALSWRSRIALRISMTVPKTRPTGLTSHLLGKDWDSHHEQTHSDTSCSLLHDP